jgi:hypothetical protein
MITQPFDDSRVRPAGQTGSAVTTAWKHEPQEPEAAEATLERINRLVARIHEEKNEPPGAGDCAAAESAEADVPVAEEVVMTQVVRPAQSDEDLALVPNPVPAAFASHRTTTTLSSRTWISSWNASPARRSRSRN